MTWTADTARSIGLPLLVPGFRFSLWDYECNMTMHRTAINDVHVLSMLLSTSSDAPVRHGLSGGGYSDFGQLGSLLFAPAGVPLHTIGRPIRTKVARLEIDRGCHTSLDDFIARRESDHLARCRNITSHDVREGMRKMALEAVSPGPLSNILVESLCHVIVVELFRYLNTFPKPSDGCIRKFSAAEVKLVSDYIESCSNNHICVQEIADIFSLSSRHFVRRFRETTGQSVHQFIKQAKVRQAKTLLMDRKLSIKEVAHRMGFASHANFSDSFLRQTGERPGAFRRKQM